MSTSMDGGGFQQQRYYQGTGPTEGRRPPVQQQRTAQSRPATRNTSQQQAFQQFQMRSSGQSSEMEKFASNLNQQMASAFAAPAGYSSLDEWIQEMVATGPKISQSSGTGGTASSTTTASTPIRAVMNDGT